MSTQLFQPTNTVGPNPCGQLVRRDDPAVEIRGSLERTPGCALIAAAGFDAQGRLELEYGGETQMYWEEQRPVREGGLLVLIDVNGHEVLETEVLLRLEDGSLVDPLLLGSFAPSAGR